MSLTSLSEGDMKKAGPACQRDRVSRSPSQGIMVTCITRDVPLQVGICTASSSGHFGGIEYPLRHCHETLTDSMEDPSTAFNQANQNRNPHEARRQKVCTQGETEWSPASDRAKSNSSTTQSSMSIVYTVGKKIFDPLLILYVSTDKEMISLQF